MVDSTIGQIVDENMKVEVVPDETLEPEAIAIILKSARNY